MTAMVGLLNAPKGTRLYQRLIKEGRVLQAMSGDNTDLSMNFIPKMNTDALLKELGLSEAQIKELRKAGAVK